MAKNTIPDNKDRDAITAGDKGMGSDGGKAGIGGGGGSPKRADLLNGQPRTKSISGGSANYSGHTTSNAYNSAPPPNNPYKGK